MSVEPGFTQDIVEHCQTFQDGTLLSDHLLASLIKDGLRVISLNKAPVAVTEDTLNNIQSKQAATLEALLVGYSPQLRLAVPPLLDRLALAGIRYTDGEFLPLQRLDISGVIEVSDGLLRTVAAVSPKLTHICVSDCTRLTGDFLEKVGEICTELQSLVVSGCTALTDERVQTFFLTAPCVSSGNLTELNVARCMVGALSAQALNTHGSHLTTLIVDGCPNMSDAMVRLIYKGCPCLVHVSCMDCDKLTAHGAWHWTGHPAIEKLSITVNLQPGYECIPPPPPAFVNKGQRVPPPPPRSPVSSDDEYANGHGDSDQRRVNILPPYLLADRSDNTTIPVGRLRALNIVGAVALAARTEEDEEGSEATASLSIGRLASCLPSTLESLTIRGTRNCTVIANHGDNIALVHACPKISELTLGTAASLDNSVEAGGLEGHEAGSEGVTQNDQREDRSLQNCLLITGRGGGVRDGNAAIAAFAVRAAPLANGWSASLLSLDVQCVPSLRPIAMALAISRAADNGKLQLLRRLRLTSEPTSTNTGTPSNSNMLLSSGLKLQLPSLEELTIQGEEFMSTLDLACPSLRTLDLDDCCNLQHVNILTNDMDISEDKAPCVEVLSTRNTAISEDCIAKLIKMFSAKIKSIDVSGCPSTSVAASAPFQCPALEVLELGEARTLDGPALYSSLLVSSLGSGYPLRVLAISHAKQLTRFHIALFACALPNLRKLVLHSCHGVKGLITPLEKDKEINWGEPHNESLDAYEITINSEKTEKIHACSTNVGTNTQTEEKILSLESEELQKEEDSERIPAGKSEKVLDVTESVVPGANVEEVDIEFKDMVTARLQGLVQKKGSGSIMFPSTYTQAQCTLIMELAEGLGLQTSYVGSDNKQQLKVATASSKEGPKAQALQNKTDKRFARDKEKGGKGGKGKDKQQDNVADGSDQDNDTNESVFQGIAIVGVDAKKVQQLMKLAATLPRETSGRTRGRPLCLRYAAGDVCPHTAQECMYSHVPPTQMNAGKFLKLKPLMDVIAKSIAAEDTVQGTGVEVSSTAVESSKKDPRTGTANQAPDEGKKLVFENLQELQIVGCSCMEGLVEVSFPSLITLTIRACKSFSSFVCDAPLLRQLDFSQCELIQGWPLSPECMPNLTHADLTNCKSLHKRFLPTLADHCKVLRRLEVFGASTGAVGGGKVQWVWGRRDAAQKTLAPLKALERPGLVVIRTKNAHWNAQRDKESGL